MATLKTIRKRILSVKNTQKITKAMKMVAAAKLRRSQQALIQARPYGEHVWGILNHLMAQLPEDHAFFHRRSEGAPARVLVLSSDRGLCGGFNSNLLRRLFYFLNGEISKPFELVVSGRKGRDFFKAKKLPVSQEWQIQSSFSFSEAMKMAETVLSAYASGEISTVYLAYNGFKSAISQEIRIRQLLPIAQSSVEKGEDLLPVIYEPSKLELFDALLPQAIAAELYLAVLESQTAELGARMSAMESATTNAKEMIGSLTLAYNRARQAAITKELMDIVNGAEALK